MIEFLEELNYKDSKLLEIRELISKAFDDNHSDYAGSYTVKTLKEIMSGILYAGHSDGGWNELIGKIDSLNKDLITSLKLPEQGFFIFSHDGSFLIYTQKTGIDGILEIINNCEDWFDEETEGFISSKKWIEKYKNKLEEII